MRVHEGVQRVLFRAEIRGRLAAGGDTRANASVDGGGSAESGGEIRASPRTPIAAVVSRQMPPVRQEEASVRVSAAFRA